MADLSTLTKPSHVVYRLRKLTLSHLYGNCFTNYMLEQIVLFLGTRLKRLRAKNRPFRFLFRTKGQTMTESKDREMRKAERSLGKILEDVEPYIKRPVVKEYSTRGRWSQCGSHGTEEAPTHEKVSSLNDLFA